MSAHLALLASVLCSACSAGDAIEDVALRLGPAAFGRAAPFRTPVVQIGDEARPVVEQPSSTILAERRKIPIENGMARFTVQLGAEVRTLPDEAIVLAVKLVQPQPLAEADEIAVGAAVLHYVRRETGWRLLRPADDPSRITIEVDEPAAESGTTLDVRIQSIGAVSEVLMSEPFTVPPRARLALGYGVANPPRDPTVGDTIFTSTLECDGRAAQRLHEARFASGEERGARWHDAILELPARGSTCHLRLEVAGGAAGRGVWSVPEILSRADRRAATRRNVVLISLDTLRADHLSAYGYPRATSPRMDGHLAARGTIFTDVSTTFPLTSPGHMSLMTGLFPGAMPRPGVLDPWTPARTFAEALRDAGYTTRAYTEDALLAGLFGFWFGFDRFVERPLVGEARGTETFADGARFLRDHRDRRFFLFLHTYKTHAPYASSPSYAALYTDAAEWDGALASFEVPLEQRAQVDAYDRAIREADDQVAAFLDELERLGLAEDTYVAVVSDHGEAFGEHGLLGHGFGAQQEQLRIPFLLRGPGVPEGARIDTTASIADVAPTLLELIGLPSLDVQGTSLHPALAGRPMAERALPFSWIAAHARGVRRGRWKLVEAAPGQPTLFDLETDPRERRPIADPASIQPLLAELARADADDRQRREMLAAAGPSRGVDAASERMIDSLRALGYLE